MLHFNSSLTEVKDTDQTFYQTFFFLDIIATVSFEAYLVLLPLEKI